jgi:hypothetical protein
VLRTGRKELREEFYILFRTGRKEHREVLYTVIRKVL